MQIVQQKILKGQELYKVSQIQMKQIRHCSIGALKFSCGNDVGYGSATLISKNIIITAAHNLIDKLRSKQCTNFQFYLGACGAADNFYSIQGYKLMPEYMLQNPTKAFQYDFAVMKLKSNPRRPILITNFLKLEPLCEQCILQEKIISIFGYPLTETNYKPVNALGAFKLHQYGLEGRKLQQIDLKQSAIKYSLSTLSGQSGASIICQNRIIGIHIGGNMKKGENVGRIITNDMIKIINKWCIQLKGDPCQIYQHTHEKNIVISNKSSYYLWDKRKSTPTQSPLIKQTKNHKKQQKSYKKLRLNSQMTPINQVVQKRHHSPLIMLKTMLQKQIKQIKQFENHKIGRSQSVNIQLKFSITFTKQSNKIELIKPNQDKNQNHHHKSVTNNSSNKKFYLNYSSNQNASKN